LVGEKLLEGSVSIEAADHLLVETSLDFDVAVFVGTGCRFAKRGKSSYVVWSGNLSSAASLLGGAEGIYAITPARRPVLKNRLGAGFSQLNTRELDSSGLFARYLNTRGLTGSGVVVHLIDSYLDPYSTYFYDPAEQVQNKGYTPNHRKIVYSEWDELAFIRGVMDEAEHGTHVAGTIAGEANCGGCAASAYDGVAPSAKLAHTSLDNWMYLARI
jgi:subtilisin family serine protease